MKKNMVVVCLIALLLAAGCTAHDPYPGQWAPLTVSPGSHCRFNTAVYRNRNPLKWGQSSLTSVLLKGGMTPLRGATFVAISSPAEGELQVTVYDRDGKCSSQQTLSVTKGDFTCENGWLQRSGSATAANAGPLRGTDTFTYELVEQEDVLVYRKRYSSRGWFGLFPVWGSGTSWGRFFATKELTRFPGPCPTVGDPL